MKIQLWSFGKSHEPYVRTGVEVFTKRIANYYSIQWSIIPAPRNSARLSETDLKKKEGEIILESLKKEDWLVVLDEKGSQFTSGGLAEFIRSRANESTKNLIFLVGGAYGLDGSVLQRANYKWSLSELTFPHQLARLILTEQLYRACTILRNEKYHHP
jgi:23S rRNA (pseudouridine1915-N3)-methyltransferase